MIFVKEKKEGRLPRFIAFVIIFVLVAERNKNSKICPFLAHCGNGIY